MITIITVITAVKNYRGWTSVKKCSKCSTERAYVEFHKKGNSYQSWCKQCVYVYHKDRRNGELTTLVIKNKLKDNLKKYKKSIKEKLEQRIVSILNKSLCVKCGETNILTLDFDHYKGKKEFGISKAISKCYSWKRISKELNKCQILCSNCHRIKTANENNSWKLKYLKA